MRKILLPLMLIVLAGASVGRQYTPSPQPLSIKNHNIMIELTDSPFRLRIIKEQAEPLLEITEGPSFTTAGGQKDPFDKGQIKPWSQAEVVVSSRKGDDYLEWEMSDRSGAEPMVRMRANLTPAGAVRVSCEIIGRPEANRLSLRFPSQADDRYFGMGERYDSAEHSGKRLYNWTEEQHLGSGKLGPFFDGQPLTRLNTYFPVPFFLNPVRGYGLLLDDTHFSEFDFGKAEPGVLEIVNYRHRMDLMIFRGDNPLDIITNYTAYTGRVKPAPAWAFGVWNAAAAKEGRAREVARVTRENRIPTSGIWSEDWAWHDDDVLRFVGGVKSQWDLNRKRYPDYEGLASDLHEDGFKFFSYFHPYIGCKSEAAREAQAKGFLAQDASGGPYVFSFLLNKVVQPDLTQPAAGEWWQQRFFKRAADYGVDGWMHDFGEYTPAESRYGNGEDGWAMHNAFPVMWAKAGREFWERERPDGDWVFWMRSGYTGSWKYAPVMWTGDQNMDWEKYDGIPSVIPAVNSVGISGSPVTATDIAGYHCIPGISPPTDKELFFRWTQLGALLPVMRTHESSGCPILGLSRDNWLFDSDHETLMHWKKYAELHVALFPYFYTLVHEAADKGWPVVRHLMLHYPEDPGSLAEEYEFMVGDRLLVAPVIVDGVREREVYFPPGAWISWWDGTRHRGPGRETVGASLDVIPLFVKSGTMIPVFDSRIDTLAKEDREDLNGWDDANRSIKVMFFGEGRDRLRLWDNTFIECDSALRKCEITGGPNRNYSWEFK